MIYTEIKLILVTANPVTRVNIAEMLAGSDMIYQDAEFDVKSTEEIRFLRFRDYVESVRKKAKEK